MCTLSSDLYGHDLTEVPVVQMSHSNRFCHDQNVCEIKVACHHHAIILFSLNSYTIGSRSQRPLKFI